MTYRVTVVIDFCYGHRLMDYDGACAHPHGHNGRVEIELERADLDDRGMVVDFGDIKRGLKKWIDERMDHRMILRSDDPLVSWMEANGEPVHLMHDNPTAENIARVIYDEAASRGFPVVAVRLWETVNSFATYRA